MVASSLKPEEACESVSTESVGNARHLNRHNTQMFTDGKSFSGNERDKLFALIASTGGGVATSCLQQMRIAVQHCHGWSLPYHTSIAENEFDKVSAQIQSPRLIDRLECTGRDLVSYGQVLQGQFQAELEGPKSESGFAAWYRKGDTV